MIIVTVSDSSYRYGDQRVDESTETPRSLFEKLNVSYQRGQTSLCGSILTGDRMDKTFAELTTELGISSARLTLNSIVKGDGGSF